MFVVEKAEQQQAANTSGDSKAAELMVSSLARAGDALTELLRTRRRAPPVCPRAAAEKPELLFCRCVLSPCHL